MKISAIQRKLPATASGATKHETRSTLLCIVWGSAFLCAGGSGCAFTSTVSAANYAGPIYVGPVKRMGHPSSDPTVQEKSDFEVEVDHALSVSSSTSGNVQTTTTTEIKEGADKLSAEATRATAESDNLRVAVDSIKFGSWDFFLIAGTTASSWITVGGKVVEIVSPDPRGRKRSVQDQSNNNARRESDE